MGKSPLEYSFKVTPIFLFIKNQAERTGCYIHHDQAKETLQLFLDEESFTNGERYIGAIQYMKEAIIMKKENPTWSVGGLKEKISPQN